MLALRSVLVIDALDAGALRAATRSAADAVLIDLAHPSMHGQRAEARALAAKSARAIAKAGRPVLVRVSDARSGEMEADIEAALAAGGRGAPSEAASGVVAGIVVAGVEEPQDLRDADVATRKHEMRLKRVPGETALLPEVDSAEGLLALARMLVAVDRVGAVVLSVDGLRADLRLGSGSEALIDHAMAEVAIHSDAARLPWIVHVTHERPGASRIATRAHEFGAAGVTVALEGEARGMNSLFSPQASEVTIARAMVAEWERARKRGEVLGVVAGEVVEAPGYDRLVDRRTVRRARALLELAAAIERRERAPE